MSRRGLQQTPQLGRNRKEESESSEEERSEEEESSEEEVGNKRKRPTSSNTNAKTPQKRATGSTGKSQSQPSTQSSSSLTAEERFKIAYEFVRYVLFSNRKKLPITKTDINKNVLSRFKDKSLHTFVYNTGIKHLEDIFGMKMVERKKEGAGAVSYILVNLNKFENEKTLNSIDAGVGNGISRDDKITRESLSLLTLILGIILLENGQLDQPVLYQHLGQLDFTAGERHPVFGDFDKLLEKYCRECYLSRRKNVVDNEQIWVYEWGQRSYLETSERYVYNFISDLYGCEIDPLIQREMEEKEKERGIFDANNRNSTRGRVPKVNNNSQQRACGNRQTIEDEDGEEEEEEEEEPPQQSQQRNQGNQQRRTTTTTTTTSSNQRR